MAKKGAIIAIFLVIIIVGATIPLFLTYQGVEFETTFGLGTDTPSSLSTSSQGSEDFQLINPSVEINEKTMNLYEYLGVKANNFTSVSDAESIGDQIVDILIILDLTTPSNNTVRLIFDPHNLEGTGEKRVVTTLGPDELGETSGEFHLSLTIRISVTPPVVDTPIFEKDIVIERDFEI
jgi:hypothetical protein